MSDSYFLLNLQSVIPDQEDLLVDLCFQYGASGVAEDLEFDQDKITGDLSTKSGESLSIQVYFTEKPEQDLFDQLKERFPNVDSQWVVEKNKDWREEWKKGLTPFELANGWWVVPSWLEAPAEVEASHTMIIDPGMAFGTGTHATTQLAAEFLSRADNLKGAQVLDVGTGTGILAILAEKLGAARVVGIEIDPDARTVARENVSRNSCLFTDILDDSVDQVSEQYPWVLANILDGILLSLRESLARCTQSGGHLLLTGVLQERENEFLSHWMNDFELIATRRIDEWCGFLLRKNS